MKIELKKNFKVDVWEPVARKTALVTGVLLVLLSVLILVNFLQTRSVDPLHNKALTELMQAHQDDPTNEAIKQQIRAVDLLARKAYFTYQWQLRTGSYLLFILVILFLISLKFMQSLKTRLPDFENPPEKQQWDEKLLARKSVLFSGVGLFVLALIGSLLTEKGWTSKPPAANELTSGISLETIRENWPNFRGPEGNGIAYNTDVPVSWDGESGDHILWKAAIPKPGFSSPVVWGNRLFITGADKTSQEIYCYDTESGDILWQAEANDIPGSPDSKPNVTSDTGFAAPTPATDGTVVVAIYATGDIACWDMDGNRLWGINLGVPDNHYGHASSLIIYQNLVLVQYDTNAGGRLVALNIQSGQIVYDVPREVGISWASPILVNTGDQFELILSANPYVIAHNPATGSVLWQVECMSGEVAPSPVYSDGWVYAVNEYAVLAGIQLNGGSAEKIWEYDNNLAEVASLAATNDLVFVATSYGTVACVDGKTGEEVWAHDFDQGFYSSPVVVGDRIYLTDMSGQTFIFKADRAFEEIGQSAIGESGMATPAFVNGKIYIRGADHLYCIGN